MKKDSKKGKDKKVLTPEERYDKAVNLFNSLDCVNPCDDKIKMCKRLIKTFEELEELHDSSELIAQCKDLIETTKSEKQERAYRFTVTHMNMAKSALDYEKVAKEFESLGDYKDAKDLKVKCENLQKANSTHAGIRVKIIGVVAALILVMVALSITSFGRYYEAKALSKVGLHGFASNFYSSLNNYKDSKSLYKQSEYHHGMNLKDKDHYESAAEAFYHADSYKDSDKYLVEMEKKMLAKKKVGDSVRVGLCNWIILDKQSDKVFLLKKKSFKNIIYSENRNEKMVNWKTASVYDWLNSDFAADNFRQTEVKNMVDMAWNTKSKPIFLLSKEEFEKYPDAQMKPKSNQWLRDTINGSFNAMFINTQGIVMDKGYDASSDQFSVRPAFWFATK